jgi:hypothetical protein
MWLVANAVVCFQLGAERALAMQRSIHLAMIGTVELVRCLLV